MSSSNDSLSSSPTLPLVAAFLGNAWCGCLLLLLLLLLLAFPFLLWQITCLIQHNSIHLYTSV